MKRTPTLPRLGNLLQELRRKLADERIVDGITQAQHLTQLGVEEEIKSKGIVESILTLSKQVSLPVKKGNKPKKPTITQSILAQYEAGLIGNPDPILLATLARFYEYDYLRLVTHLVKEKYSKGVPWEEVEGACERFQLLLASWEQPGLPGVDERTLSGKRFMAAQLRCKANLVKEMTLLDIDTLAEWEREITNVQQFWVIAPDFLADHDDSIQESVLFNLSKKSPVSYYYFIHPENVNRFYRYRATIKELLHKKAKNFILENHLRGYRLEEEAVRWIATDHLIANPDVSSKTLVFRYLRHNEHRFAHLLSSQEASLLTNRWRSWDKFRHELRDDLPRKRTR